MIGCDITLVDANELADDVADDLACNTVPTVGVVYTATGDAVVYLVPGGVGIVYLVTEGVGNVYLVTGGIGIVYLVTGD